MLKLTHLFSLKVGPKTPLCQMLKFSMMVGGGHCLKLDHLTWNDPNAFRISPVEWVSLPPCEGDCGWGMCHRSLQSPCQGHCAAEHAQQHLMINDNNKLDQKKITLQLVIIIIYHDFLPTPRRGSHVKSDKTQTQ